jgi:hypothetical protein
VPALSSRGHANAHEDATASLPALSSRGRVPLGERACLCEHASERACFGFLRFLRRFLRDLEWVYVRSVDWEGGISTLVCVHAGLNPAAPLQDQLRALRERDMSDPVLYAGSSSRKREATSEISRSSEIASGSSSKTREATAGKQLEDGCLPEDGCTLSDERPGERIEALCGRSELFPLHPDHSSSSIVVSGHHGVSFSSQNHHRIILDRSGGKGKLPLEAIVLPQKRVIGHDGSVRKLTDEPIGANEKRVRKEMGYPVRAKTT